MKEIKSKFIEDPLSILSYLLGMVYFLIQFKTGRKISFDSIPKIIGIPIIHLKKSSNLVIGKNVLIRSRNKGYHINMNSPSKIMCESGATIKIGNNTRIYGSCIHASKKIIIGSNCLIASNTNIIDRNGHSLSFDNPSNRINTFGSSKEIIIEDNVWIGANVMITPGVTIGSGSIISSNSLVNSNIPSMCIASGVPAKILKEYTTI